MSTFMAFSEIKQVASELQRLAQEIQGKSMDTQELDKPIVKELSKMKEATDVEGTKAYPRQETVDGVTYYYDDNGKLYRTGNELEPNSTYELNGYEYETDDLGRIKSVQGELHMKERDSRLPMKDSLDDIGKGDQQEGDDRGHLIGDQFDGVNGLENMIPQDADVNRKDFRNFENELADEVKSGNEVRVKIEPVYEGDSHRPKEIRVSYSINGEEDIVIFPNSKEV